MKTKMRKVTQRSISLLLLIVMITSSLVVAYADAGARGTKYWFNGNQYTYDKSLVDMYEDLKSNKAEIQSLKSEFDDLHDQYISDAVADNLAYAWQNTVIAAASAAIYIKTAGVTTPVLVDSCVNAWTAWEDHINGASATLTPYQKAKLKGISDEIQELLETNRDIQATLCQAYANGQIIYYR